MSHTTLISTDELGAHLRGARPTEAAWAIVDCRFDLNNEDWGREQYVSAHIPGAVYANLNTDLAGERTGTNGRHPLPSMETLAATFARLGIARHTQVVAYDQDTGKVVWEKEVSGPINGVPAVYEMNGRQYIAVCVAPPAGPAGRGGTAGPQSASEYVVFALPAK